MLHGGGDLVADGGVFVAPSRPDFIKLPAVGFEVVVEIRPGDEVFHQFHGDIWQENNAMERIGLSAA